MKNKNILRWLGVFLIIWYLSTSNLFATQIEKTIDYRFGQKAADFYGESKFTARITFDPLPKLLETTIVHVKIMAMGDFDFDPEYMVITKYSNLIDFTQLMPTIWTPPIKEGDLYEGTFTITPTEIGPFSIVIIPRAPQLKLLQRFEFYLIIDESGKLVHLSKMRDVDYTETINHPPIVGDEIRLKYRVSKRIDGSINDDFINVFNISPLPALNETSIVRFELTANRECPEGIQFDFSWRDNIEIIDIPNSWIGEVKKGQVHIDSFKIIPKTTGCGRINLSFWAHSNPVGIDLQKRPSTRLDRAMETYNIFFFINESGKTTFIGRAPTKKLQKDCGLTMYKLHRYSSEPKVFKESRKKKKD